MSETLNRPTPLSHFMVHYIFIYVGSKFSEPACFYSFQQISFGILLLLASKGFCDKFLRVHVAAMARKLMASFKTKER